MKKKVLSVLLALVLVLSFSLVTAVPVAAGGGKNAGCNTIKDGVILYSEGHYLEGEPLKVGYDIFGYNYQAHQFNGSYANSYLGKDGYPPYEGDAEAYLAANEGVDSKWYWQYRDVQLLMKWNDAWLSNKDCDDDGILDRHYGFASYIGSGAWDTNHQSGSYEVEGKTYKWTYFVKIVAAPTGAYKDGGIWYTAEDTEIGPVIWGSYAVLQRVYNDQGTGEHGIELLSPASPGFGAYK